jgi:hypothetical protein
MSLEVKSVSQGKIPDSDSKKWAKRLKVKSDFKGNKKSHHRKRTPWKNYAKRAFAIEERCPLVGRRTNNSLQSYYEEAKVIDIGQTKTPSSITREAWWEWWVDQKAWRNIETIGCCRNCGSNINKQRYSRDTIHHKFGNFRVIGPVKIIDVPSLPAAVIAKIPSEEIVEASSLETLEIIEA